MAGSLVINSSEIGRARKDIVRAQSHGRLALAAWLVLSTLLSIVATAAPASASAVPSSRPLTPVLIAPGAGLIASGGDSGLSAPVLGYLGAITCPTNTVCYAVGRSSYGATGPSAGLVVTLSRRAGGPWAVTAATIDWDNVYYLSSITCVNVKTCVATGAGAGGAAVVLATDSGNGPNWDEPPVPQSTLPLSSVSCAGNYCMAVGSALRGQGRRAGYASQIWVTSPGAQRGLYGEPGWVALKLFTFRSAGATYDPALGAVSCPRAADCWVVGGGAWHTSDGGRSWADLSPPALPPNGGAGFATYSWLDSAQFSSPGHGIVAGGDQCGSGREFVCPGAIFLTSDGGRHWARAQPARSIPFIESLSCVPPQDHRCIATAEEYAGSRGPIADVPVASQVLLSVDGREWRPGKWATGISVAGGACPPVGTCLAAGGPTTGALGLAYLVSSLPNSEVSSIGSSLPKPWDAFGPVKGDVVNAAIALGMALFMTFPANLFNATFEENYDDIVAWWQKWRDRLLPAPLRRSLRRAWERAKAWLSGVLGLAGKPRGPVLGRVTGSFVAVLLVGPLLGALLDPSFGPNFRTVLSYIAIVVAMAAGVAISGAVTGGYHRALEHGAVPYKLEALPAGLAIALACVLISRGTGFTPGYLYGVICGASFGRQLATNEEGHLVALGSVARVVLGIVAWFAWASITSYASRPGSFFGVVLADDFLASLFVSGLVGTVISLFPLKFLPGHKLRTWHQGAWLATFTVSLFVLVQVLLRPHSTSSGPSHTPLVTTLVLFVLFGAGSLLFRDHFARKRRRAETVAVEGDIDFTGVAEAAVAGQPASASSPSPSPSSPSAEVSGGPVPGE